MRRSSRRDGCQAYDIDEADLRQATLRLHISSLGEELNGRMV